MGSTRTKAFTVIEFIVVISIIALLVSILLPSLQRARELSMELAQEAAGTIQSSTESEKLNAAREAAQEAAEELEIDDRVRAITDCSGGHVESTVFVDQPEGTEATDETRTRKIKMSVKTKYNADGSDIDVISVEIDGKEVYRSAQGEVSIYRGLGEWEDALDRVQWRLIDAARKRQELEREAREYEFKAERERRFGPLTTPINVP